MFLIIEVGLQSLRDQTELIMGDCVLFLFRFCCRLCFNSASGIIRY